MKFRVTTVIAAFAMALASSGYAAATPVANTICGPVKGTLTPGIAEFLGVRYAASTAGNLRWTPPKAPAHWAKPINATQFGSACPQTASVFPAVPTGEDCLFLNVYVPTSHGTDIFNQAQDPAQDKKRFPVMVWIHGGTLSQGASNYYDPTPLVKNGNVTVVTINYRLGALGFLAHPALSAETSYNGSGNYGLMDQQFATRWVQQNIRAFGGDPHNVTIFGESASVLAHMASPTAAGLFNRAIAESGVNDLGLAFLGLPSALTLGSLIATNVGCSSQTAACLRSVGVQTLLDNSGPPLGGNLVPDIDGNVLTQPPFAAFQSGEFNRVPLINSTNHDEYRYFVSSFDPEMTQAGSYIVFLSAVYGPLLGQVFAAYYRLVDYQNNADLAYSTLITDGFYSCTAVDADQTLSQYVPIYTYEFADENAPPILPPATYTFGFPQGAEYFSEAQYLFNLSAAGEPSVPFTANQQLLSNAMIRYWTGFATSGDPNQTGLSVWPSFSGTEAEENFLSLVAPTPVVESESDFVTDHKCNGGGLPPPLSWVYFIDSVQSNPG